MAVAEPLVWLIDGYVQIFRAYHSMPDLRAPDGRPVGALRGYLSSLVRFLTRQQPTHVLVAWDFALTSFRNEIYQDYKRGRTEAPQDLATQIPLCARATRALGIPLFELEGFEADDVIATLVRQLREEGARLAIVTTDKDLGVLVDARTSLFDLRAERHLGAEEIEARFGVPPERLSDYLSLAGDAVDNIPGARGIGAKTAAALLNHFGSLDAIPGDFAAWGELSLRGAARAHRAFQAAADEIALSRRLVALRDDLPLDVELAAVVWRGGERDALESLLEETGGRAVLERVPAFRQ